MDHGSEFFGVGLQQPGRILLPSLDVVCSAIGTRARQVSHAGAKHSRAGRSSTSLAGSLLSDLLDHLVALAPELVV
jgi:hypothetical protein